MIDLAARMNAAEREKRWKNTRPRDASTLVLLDFRGGRPHVLMGRRDKSLKFMPGMFVFPGGRVDRADRFAPHTGALDAASRDRLLEDMKGKASEGRARALALTAIRETYEETGILLGAPGTPSRPPRGDWAGFAEHGVLPDLSAITFFARAITPPKRPRRFDTRFFTATADAIGHQLSFENRPHKELGELQWIELEEAKNLDMPAITGVILEELGHRIDNGRLARDTPVPYYFERRGSFVRLEL